MPNAIKNHDINCEECRKLTNEAYVQKSIQIYIDTKFRSTLKEEFQTEVKTIERIDRIEKIMYWLIGVQMILIAGLGALSIFILNNH